MTATVAAAAILQKTHRKKLCVAGKNRIAVQGLEVLCNSGFFEVLVCPTSNDNGCDSWQPSLRKKAEELGKRVVTLDEIYEIPGLIFLSLEYDKIIKPQKFKNAELLNIHFSLLPAYKGCFTSIWPIYNGETQTGVTLHYIDEGIDTGDILDQEPIEIDRSVTARILYEKYQDAALSLLSRNIENIYNSSWHFRHPQPASGSSYFSRKSLSKLSLEIDPWLTAEQISLHVRSLYFPEFQTATLGYQNIIACDILPERSTATPGTIIFEDSAIIRMATIDYDVLLHKSIN